MQGRMNISLIPENYARRLIYLIIRILKSILKLVHSSDQRLGTFHDIAINSGSPSIELIIAISTLMDDLHLFDNGGFS